MTLSDERIKEIEDLVKKVDTTSFGVDSFLCQVYGSGKICFFYRPELKQVSYRALAGNMFCGELTHPYHSFEGTYAGKYNSQTIFSLLSALSEFGLITFEERIAFVEYIGSEDTKIHNELNNNFSRLESEAKKFGFKLSR
jgi:hypothetical protein